MLFHRTYNSADHGEMQAPWQVSRWTCKPTSKVADSCADNRHNGSSRTPLASTRKRCLLCGLRRRAVPPSRAHRFCELSRKQDSEGYQFWIVGLCVELLGTFYLSWIAKVCRAV